MRPARLGHKRTGRLAIATPRSGRLERLREAAKHGFRRALVPKANAPRREMAGIEITAPERLEAALASI